MHDDFLSTLNYFLLFFRFSKIDKNVEIFRNCFEEDKIRVAGLSLNETCCKNFRDYKSQQLFHDNTTYIG